MPRQKKQHLKKRKDGRYACRYKDHWFYGNTEEEALAQRELYKQLENQKASAPVTVKEFAEGWIKRTSEGNRRATYVGKYTHLKKLIKAYGEKELSEITPSMIKDLYSTEYSGLSSDYIKHAKNVFDSIFDAALDDKLCDSNPARANSAKPHKGIKGSHRSITPLEREWIDNLCKDHPVYPAVMTMLYAGVRPQEAKAIDIDKHMNMEKKEISIEQTAHLADDNLNEYEIDSDMKTKKSARKIPMFPPVLEAIKNKHGMLIPFPGKRLTESDWVKLWRSYKSQMETTINGMTFRVYLNRSAKEPIPPFIRFTVAPYDLRHSFATWCRDYGVELHTVIEWMGHSDSDMILRIYDEVSDDRSKKEADKLLKTAFRSQFGSQEQSQKPQNA